MKSSESNGATAIAEIDVVILTWNDGEDAKRAIESVAASAGVRTAVHVIDNASDVAFDSPDVPISVVVDRAPFNLGVGGGRNRGAALGGAPYLCFLDSDAVLAPDCLERLVEPMVDDASIGLAAPVFLGQSPTIGAGRAPGLGRKLARGLGMTDRYRAMRQSRAGVWDIEFAIGACQVVRRSVFTEIDGIDASARFGPEDLDMCLRIADSGFRLVQVEAAVCDHVARRSSRRWLSRRGLAHAGAVARHYWRRWRRRRRLRLAPDRDA